MLDACARLQLFCTVQGGIAARGRGMLFGIGHGGNSFDLSEAQKRLLLDDFFINDGMGTLKKSPPLVLISHFFMHQLYS